MVELCPRSPVPVPAQEGLVPLGVRRGGGGGGGRHRHRRGVHFTWPGGIRKRAEYFRLIAICEDIIDQSLSSLSPWKREEREEKEGKEGRVFGGEGRLLSSLQNCMSGQSLSGFPMQIEIAASKTDSASTMRFQESEPTTTKIAPKPCLCSVFNLLEVNPPILPRSQKKCLPKLFPFACGKWPLVSKVTFPSILPYVQ